VSDASADSQHAREAQTLAQQLARGLDAISAAHDVEIGTAPKDAVYREDKLVLYRYRRPDAGAGVSVRTPLLICYALVNRPYMMDLQPDRSMIRSLLQAGVDVYLIDWGYADGADRYLDMDDYILRYMDHCVRHVREASGHERINLLGVCQGGTMSLCYAALHPHYVRNLATMVTPVDFRTPENLLTKWAEHLDIDALVRTSGNVPGEWLNAVFVSLLPFRLMSQKYMNLSDHLDDPRALQNFLRMEKWIFDSPDQAGEMFRQFVTLLVRENRLAAGTLQLGGRAVDLKRIDMPVLNIYALQDHLVPPAASRPLRGLVGTADYTEHEFDGGHIGIHVSVAAREIPARIAGWLRERE